MTKLTDQFPANPDAMGRGASVSRQTAIDALHELIAEGKYAPGDRLPPERELIVRLGLTRSTLRKALEALETDGVIWRHVGKGTFISSEAESGGVKGLQDLAKQITPVKMMRARMAIEPAIAREAAMNAAQDALAKIKEARDGALNAPTWEDYEEYDDRIHRQIALATDNLLLISIFDQLNQVRRAVAWGSVVRSSIRPPETHPSFSEHDMIVAAIAARDPKAAQETMRNHLASVESRLFGEG